MRAKALHPLPKWRLYKESGSATLYQLMVWLALRLGRRTTQALLIIACLYCLAFAKVPRAASRLYLSRVLLRRSKLIDQFRHFSSFATCVLDRVYFMSDRCDLFKITVTGENVIANYCATNTGFILLGAHLGSFEVLAATARSNARLKVGMAMYNANAQKLSAALAGVNPGRAADIIHLGRPDAIIDIRERITNGQIVGILADRSLINNRLVPCSFLGATAQFSANPFRILSVIDAPVVLMVGLYRGGNRYDIHFEPFAERGEIPRQSNPAALAAMVMRYVARLEYYCRLAPYNWFNFYNVWA